MTQAETTSEQEKQPQEQSKPGAFQTHLEQVLSTRLGEVADRGRTAALRRPKADKGV